MSEHNINMDEPLSSPGAKALIDEIRESGEVSFSRHARDEMQNDDLSEIDVDNVLRGGYVEDLPDFEKGTWRYRVCTSMYFDDHSRNCISIRSFASGRYSVASLGGTKQASGVSREVH